MDLKEWMILKQKDAAWLSMKTGAEKETVRSWIKGATPRYRASRNIIFIETNGQVSWDKDFEDHPDTTVNRVGGRSVKGR